MRSGIDPAGSPCCSVPRLTAGPVAGDIRTDWVELGDHGARLMVTGGRNDIGGPLVREAISRMAVADNGSLETVPQLQDLAGA